MYHSLVQISLLIFIDNISFNLDAGKDRANSANLDDSVGGQQQQQQPQQSTGQSIRAKKAAAAAAAAAAASQAKAEASGEAAAASRSLNEIKETKAWKTRQKVLEFYALLDRKCESMMKLV